MGVFKGGLRRFMLAMIYAITFICSVIILGIYSYFLSILADRNIPIGSANNAVEGISGITAVYLIAAVLLTLCFAGVPVLAYTAIGLDSLFFIAMLVLAVLTRHGASSCTGNVETPIGNGPAQADHGFGKNGFGSGNEENLTYSVHLGLACRLNTACFVVSIIAALLFLAAAGMQLVVLRGSRKEKDLTRYDQKSSGMKSGAGKFMFWRK